MPKQSDDLSREGEPSQTTDKGLEIPIPKTKDFDRLLKRAAKKQSPGEPSQSDQEKPRTSP